MTDLNPCPDCGREPEIKEFKSGFYVGCDDCGSVEVGIARAAASAANAWNAATIESTVVTAKKSLRDEFAMAALIGMRQIEGLTYADIASSAYGMADAMMQEREK